MNGWFGGMIPKRSIMIIRGFDIDYLDSIRPLQPKGWSDITRLFEFYARHDFCYPIMVLNGTDAIGVGNATRNGETGWLAHIIVAENYRRFGIGSLLTGHLIDLLHAEGCRTILLMATEAGRRMYEKFGFETVGEYLCFEETMVMQDVQNVHIRRFRSDDRGEIMAIDRLVSGEDRIRILEHFMTDAHVYVTDAGVEGFFLPTLDEGMIVAANDTAGLALLAYKHNRKKRKTVIPVENDAAARHLSSMGYEAVSRIPRMSLGEEIRWKPELVFSRAGGFYG
jgi:GNAT superfamily N-acetyltransferase